ncbi:hypothetical protein [Saccharothrix lopnurensis]|uniref:Guanylate cyclase domain-containing protein n=1 Tax=Saccharothrix lopnurensis TaxID=1670621 RepID=A0ABW1NWY8_9PSEU
MRVREPAVLPDPGGAVVRFDYVQEGPDLTALSLVVRFRDPAVEVRDARVAAAGTVVRTGVWTTRDGALVCLVGTPLGRSPIPRSGAFEILVAPPAELTGSLRVHGSALRPGLAGGRPAHACGDREVRFAAGRVDPVAGRRPAVRLCLAVDTEAYSRFSAPEAERAQRRFADLLTDVRRVVGVDDDETGLQPSGDGLFTVLPPGVDESVVIPGVVDGLRSGLVRINRGLGERARLRLRVAMHRGHVALAANGWIGSAVTTVHRLLDSEVLRRALRETPTADFALVVSDVLYRDVIVDGYPNLDPDRFASVTAEVPAKRFAETAWLYLPEG